MGGSELEKQQVDLLFNLVDHAVVGIFEVLKNYAFFRKIFNETLRWISENRPKTILLVDYPGFNLRLAEALREKNLSKKGGGDSSTPVCESTALGMESQKKIQNGKDFGLFGGYLSF